MRTVRSLFSVSGSSLLAWGLLVSVTSGCGKGDDGPKLNCPNGMRTIWLDALNNVGECEVITPLGDGRAPRSGLEQAYPAMNRPPGALTTPERIELGRLLYFDPILSGDNSVACASCHHPANGFTDNRAVSTGIRGQKGGRSAPTVWNAAWSGEQFWDGRAKTLEDQAKGPIQNPIEMDQNPALLLTELKAIPEYSRRFDEAFRGSGGSAVTLDNIASAIAAFERTIASVNSPFDRYAAGDRSAMNESAVRGLNLFRSVSTRCFECHELPTFAMKEYKVLGVPSLGDPTKVDDDRGRAAISPGASVERAFRVPTLRNVAKTAPYMHNGSLKTLDEVLEFYAKGGGLGRGYKLDNVDDKIRKFDLTPDEKADLTAFLEALTDESMLPEVPKQVPSGLPVPKGPL